MSMVAGTIDNNCFLSPSLSAIPLGTSIESKKPEWEGLHAWSHKGPLLITLKFSSFHSRIFLEGWTWRGSVGGGMFIFVMFVSLEFGNLEQCQFSLVLLLNVSSLNDQLGKQSQCRGNFKNVKWIEKPRISHWEQNSEKNGDYRSWGGAGV